MDDFTALKTKESLVRKRLDRCIENGKKTGTSKRTQGFYEQKIFELRKLWAEYCDVDAEIHQAFALDPVAIPEKYMEIDRYGTAEMKFSEYIGELAEGLGKFQPIIDQPDTQKVQTTTVIQQESSLPKINIPKFDGNYDLWRSFHDIFMSLVHTNTKLTSVQKLYHLKSCLTGDAEKLLRHTPITDADYDPAWKKLQERYDNKRILVNHL